MADDIFCGLRDTLQLPDLKTAIAVHERASGGLNNWLKTGLAYVLAACVALLSCPLTGTPAMLTSLLT